MNVRAKTTLINDAHAAPFTPNPSPATAIRSSAMLSICPITEMIIVDFDAPIPFNTLLQIEHINVGIRLPAYIHISCLLSENISCGTLSHPNITPDPGAYIRNTTIDINVPQNRSVFTVFLRVSYCFAPYKFPTNIVTAPAIPCIMQYPTSSAEFTVDTTDNAVSFTKRATMTLSTIEYA